MSSPPHSRKNWQILCVAALASSADLSAADRLTPDIPKLWDDAAIESLELPLANADWSPRHVPAEWYYRIPVAPIYRSYPIYHPDAEPAGYFENLHTVEPEVLWDDQGRRPKLETEADWIAAGELAFDAPVGIGNDRGIPTKSDELDVRDREWYRDNAIPLTPDGVMPWLRYVVRTRGKVEVGVGSCAMCHTRLMPDGSLIKGAQGNPPIDRLGASAMARWDADDPAIRRRHRTFYATPWLQPDPEDALFAGPMENLIAHTRASLPGAIVRHGSQAALPIQVPDLIGIRGRRYLDRTGLVRHEDIGDLMRYSALNQNVDIFASYNGYIPAAADLRTLPEPTTGRPPPHRQSDEQRYALALFLYSLKPPPSPHPFDARAARGREIFHAEGCARCHDPDQGYTNNKLIAAPGFTVPADHPERAHIMNRRVGTDGALALTTRRGTGFYKVPSLRGVWYRGPFEHNGSVATLEDWFDPRRLDDDYVPTGWKGPPGTTTRAVKGHEFGLDLTDDERDALIAFLKTL